MKSRLAILAALTSALLFGASTPFVKSLAGTIHPVLLAGLLYLGSGAGLWMIRLLRDRGFGPTRLKPGEWPWLVGAITSGGVFAPVFLLWGLARTSAATASLLLNLEVALTALLAWLAFHENADRRVVTGLALILCGGLALAWPLPGASLGDGSAFGPLAVCTACLFWAIDNNLTGKVSAADALFLAGTKGLVAGATNIGIAMLLGTALPAPGVLAKSLLIGFAGYGISLVLFVQALRGLGTARTAAYFATAPFIGAALAIAFFHEATSAQFWVAAAAMAGGVWLHLGERHEHTHRHERLVHSHPHRHDEHHQHAHSFPWSGAEPHSHEHEHEPLVHRHAHYPDLHHRHGH
jgi:drug/metabolite transporter (DMT)-like permease